MVNKRISTLKPNKEQERKAAFFCGLGHRRRQMLYDVLLQIGAKGLTFGALQQRTGLTASTLSHHLRFMDQGGILRRQQKGRETWLSLDLRVFAEIPLGSGSA